MSWHVPAAILSSYAKGSLDEARSLSIEAHVAACGLCHLRAAALIDSDRLDALWERISSTVWSEPEKSIEKILVRFGRGEHLYRLMVMVPSLRGPWIIAVGMALAFALGATFYLDGSPLPFLTTAPLLPLAGVAAAFGSRFDPTHEIASAAPMSGFKLLLIRTSAVLAYSIGLAGVMATPLLPYAQWTAVAWLLPSLSLAAVTIALSTVMSLVRAAAVSGTAWLALVFTTAPIAGDSFAIFGPEGQLMFGFAIAVSIIFLLYRRETLERRIQTWPRT